MQTQTYQCDGILIIFNYCVCNNQNQRIKLMQNTNSTTCRNVQLQISEAVVMSLLLEFRRKLKCKFQPMNFKVIKPM